MSGEKMMQAYRMLFEIEYSLKEEIRTRMLNKYGVTWEHSAPRLEKRMPLGKSYSQFKFYDLEQFLSYTIWEDRRKKVGKKAFDKLIVCLHQCFALRNKVAHCEIISSMEFFQIKENYLLIMDILGIPLRYVPTKVQGLVQV